MFERSVVVNGDGDGVPWLGLTPGMRIAIIILSETAQSEAMAKYLTELLRLPVVDADGAVVARVADAAATVAPRLPELTALLVVQARTSRWISLDGVTIAAGRVELGRPLASIPDHVLADSDVLLRRDVLDKQIVDVHDYRVVRVSDVRLADRAGRLCVVGVDAGLRAIVRRAGIGKPVEALARLVGRPLGPNLIAWSDVETLEPDEAGGGRIRLKVPQGRIARLHPADIADIVEQLDPQQRAEILESLDVETAADTLEEMEDEEAAAVMATLEDERAADILEEMEPDEAADLLGDLTDERSEELLDHMQPAEKADVVELMAYGDETAGGLMTNDYLAIKPQMTADDTIALLRRLAPKAQSIYYLYVVDDEERLVGVTSLRNLIIAAPDAPISSIMMDHVRHLHTSDHADEAAQLLSRYSLLALPVVDDDGILVGIITVDDMMERLVPPERPRRLPQVEVEPE